MEFHDYIDAALKATPVWPVEELMEQLNLPQSTEMEITQRDQAIEARIRQLRDKDVRAVRLIGQSSKNTPERVRVVWRVDFSERIQTLDVDTRNDSGVAFVEFECRAPTHNGAIQLAMDIVDRFACDKTIIEVLDEYDKEDDRSSEMGEYYSRVVVIGIVGGTHEVKEHPEYMEVLQRLMES